MVDFLPQSPEGWAFLTTALGLVGGGVAAIWRYASKRAQQPYDLLQASQEARIARAEKQADEVPKLIGTVGELSSSLREQKEVIRVGFEETQRQNAIISKNGILLEQIVRRLEALDGRRG